MNPLNILLTIQFIFCSTSVKRSHRISRSPGRYSSDVWQSAPKLKDIQSIITLDDVKRRLLTTEELRKLFPLCLKIDPLIDSALIKVFEDKLTNCFSARTFRKKKRNGNVSRYEMSYFKPSPHPLHAGIGSALHINFFLFFTFFFSRTWMALAFLICCLCFCQRLKCQSRTFFSELLSRTRRSHSSLCQMFGRNPTWGAHTYTKTYII